MHREHIEEAIFNAYDHGKDIAVYAETESAAQDLAERFEAAPGPDPSRISHVNGRRRLDYPSGGTIHFVSLQSNGGRGMVLDRIYVPIGTDGDSLAEVVPALTMRDGALTGY